MPVNYADLLCSICGKVLIPKLNNIQFDGAFITKMAEKYFHTHCGHIHRLSHVEEMIIPRGTLIRDAEKCIIIQVGSP